MALVLREACRGQTQIHSSLWMALACVVVRTLRAGTEDGVAAFHPAFVPCRYFMNSNMVIERLLVRPDLVAIRALIMLAGMKLHM